VDFYWACDVNEGRLQFIGLSHEQDPLCFAMVLVYLEGKHLLTLSSAFIGTTYFKLLIYNFYDINSMLLIYLRWLLNGLNES
jgi:hypothetical protein